MPHEHADGPPAPRSGAVGEPAREGDLRVVLDIEEIRAAQVLIARRLSRPDPGGIDLALEGRVKAPVPAELELAVDVLEQAALNRPRTHVTIMWRARNSASVAGHSSQPAIDEGSSVSTILSVCEQSWLIPRAPPAGSRCRSRRRHDAEQRQLAALLERCVGSDRSSR
jgi:hypothetical protein